MSQKVFLHSLEVSANPLLPHWDRNQSIYAQQLIRSEKFPNPEWTVLPPPQKKNKKKTSPLQFSGLLLSSRIGYTYINSYTVVGVQSDLVLNSMQTGLLKSTKNTAGRLPE